MSSDEYDFASAPTNAAVEKAPHACRVCGVETIVMYLGVQCCSSCKMFFRRNVDFDLGTNRCVFTGNCDITVLSRAACRYCRFKKCLSVGLQRDSIHASHPHNDDEQKGKRAKTSHTIVFNRSTAILPTLDLLLNDRSLLTMEQWSLLSNVTHAYEEKSPTRVIRDTITHQLTFPSKIRVKMAMDYFKEIASSLYLSAGPFIKTMPEFLRMSINDQGILVERNITSMSGFGAILLLRETDICNNAYYHSASIATYGRRFTEEAMRIFARTDTDGTLIKLMVPILALSTSSDVLDPDQQNIPGSTTTPGGTRIFSDTLHLFHVQNTYVDMLFKYMLYRYGFREASLRFASLIKSSLDQNLMVGDDGDLISYHRMVQFITDLTEQSLTLEDQTTG